MMFPNLFRIYSKLTTIYHSYSTRNSQALRTPIGKSEEIYQTFTYIGSLAWNYISSKIPNVSKAYLSIYTKCTSHW